MNGREPCGHVDARVISEPEVEVRQILTEWKVGFDVERKADDEGRSRRDCQRIGDAVARGRRAFRLEGGSRDRLAPNYGPAGSPSSADRMRG